MRPSQLAVAIMAAVAAVVGVSAQAPAPSFQGPARDTPAQQQPASIPMGMIAGRVLTGDTGRPVKRARVFASAPELPGGRAMLTDDNGLFELPELPAGRYTLRVSKTGFVSLSYGQRRPLQAGTPIQLAEGQQIKGIEFRLPRGSVIDGHVYDESGEAMPGILVRVLRYQYAQGQRRLVPAGTSQTDDRGYYRVWGLNPGDYYVDAQQRLNFGFGRGGFGRGGRGGVNAAIAGVVGAIAGGNVASLLAPEEDSQKSYAPTYYPGVTSVGDARPITVGLGQEASAIDFALQLVPVSRVAGHVIEPDGTAAWGGLVQLLPEQAPRGRGAFGLNYGSRISWDGAFEINNVPPGRYTLQARGPNDDNEMKFATQPVSVSDGVDLDGLSVLLEPGATVTGVQLPVTAVNPPDLGQVRVTVPSVGPSAGGTSQTRAGKDGTFTVTAVQAGTHLIRLAGSLGDWQLETVSVNGRDVTDAPIELSAGQRLANVVITLTDKTTDITGLLTRGPDMPVTEYTVLAFSTDPAFWQAPSRHIATARPDQTGQYHIHGLPAGTYYVVTVDPTEQGEWFDPTYLDQHRSGAARVSLAEGGTATQDFRIQDQ
jgi:hypothetical protein